MHNLYDAVNKMSALDEITIDKVSVARQPGYYILQRGNIYTQKIRHSSAQPNLGRRLFPLNCPLRNAVGL